MTTIGVVRETGAGERRGGHTPHRAKPQAATSVLKSSRTRLIGPATTATIRVGLTRGRRRLRRTARSPCGY